MNMQNCMNHHYWFLKIVIYTGIDIRIIEELNKEEKL